MDTMNDMLLIIDEPTKYLEVIYDIYSNKWLKAMDFMYQSILELGWST
jgi:hypothetical protein